MSAKDPMARGCSDGAPPETYTNEQMSRVSDALNLINDVLGKDAQQAAWATFPHALKMDMIYSRWRYVPVEGKTR